MRFLEDRGKLDDTLAAMFSNIEFKTTYLFYAHIVAQCSIKMDPELPAPAGVSFTFDHYNLYINKEKFDEFPLRERLAIIKHEMLHILGGHVERSEERVHIPWNYATDCAINQLIDPAHLNPTFITPKNLGEYTGTVLNPNESSEYYYQMIYKKNKDQNDGHGDGEGDGKGNSPKLMDSHDTWNETTGDPDLQKHVTKNMISKAQTETLKNKGTIPNECSDWLTLHSKKSEVNWKRVVRGIIGNKRVGKRSTIMRSDRRFSKRDDLRGHTKERMFNLLVIADVSGSMSDKALLATLGEVRHICDLTKTAVDLIQIDTVAYKPEKLSKTTKIITRKGDGGTRLNPALEMAREHRIDYQAVIVLTDGGLFDDDITHFQKLGKRVIWLIEPTGSILQEMNTRNMVAFKLKSDE